MNPHPVVDAGKQAANVLKINLPRTMNPAKSESENSNQNKSGVAISRVLVAVRAELSVGGRNALAGPHCPWIVIS